MSNDVTTLARFTPVTPVAVAREGQQSKSDEAQLERVKTSVANALTALHTDTRNKEPEVPSEALKAAIKQGNAYFQAERRDLHISVDDDTKKVVVKIIDRASGELIRQMPTKEALDFVRKMQQQSTSNGLLIKQNV